VKPAPLRRGLADPDGDVKLYFAYERLRPQSKTDDEAISILTADNPDDFEAVQQRLKRLRRRLRGDN
jgi:hypothetical protein